MSFRPIKTLADPWWERQQGETPHLHARFVEYLHTPKRERSYKKLAENVGVATATVDRQAMAHRWGERVSAWDAEQSRQLQERVADQAERLADAHMSAATELLYAVRRSVRHVIDNSLVLDPEQAAKWADVSIRMARAAQEAPDQVVAITGRNGGPVQVEIPELDGLTQSEQQHRLTEMLSSVARLDDYRRGRDAG